MALHEQSIYGLLSLVPAAAGVVACGSEEGVEGVVPQFGGDSKTCTPQGEAHDRLHHGAGTL